MLGCGGGFCGGGVLGVVGVETGCPRFFSERRFLSEPILLALISFPFWLTGSFSSRSKQFSAS